MLHEFKYSKFFNLTTAQLGSSFCTLRDLHPQCWKHHRQVIYSNLNPCGLEIPKSPLLDKKRLRFILISLFCSSSKRETKGSSQNLDNLFKTKWILIRLLEEGPVCALFYTGSLVSALKPCSE